VQITNTQHTIVKVMHIISKTEKCVPLKAQQQL